MPARDPKHQEKDVVEDVEERTSGSGSGNIGCSFGGCCCLVIILLCYKVSAWLLNLLSERCYKGISKMFSNT